MVFIKDSILKKRKIRMDKKNQDSTNIFSEKKAQKSAGSASTLVILLAGLFLLYILFLPPDVRESMLNPDNETYEDGESAIVKKLLLDESPGRIDRIAEDDYEHNIPSFNLMKTTSSRAFVQENPFLIRKTWFSEKNKIITFQIPNLEETDNLQLSFNAQERKGRLIMELNGIEIYNNKIPDTLVEPIPLDKTYLVQNNRLRFRVNSPDWKFWESNSYAINNLIIAGDVSDSGNLEGSHSFFVEAEEKRNVNEARLVFTPLCQRGNVGKLSVNINGVNVYSSVPDCGYPSSIDFTPDILKEDSNTITFRSSAGKYLIDTVSIRTKVSDSYYPTYYFDLSSQQMSDIENKNDKINLSVKMLDNEEFKEAYIFINEHRAYIDTRDAHYTRNIKEFVEEGTNTVQVKPKNSFDIVRLRVVLYD